MFTELEANTKRGWVEVICGAMFSGKTEELLRRVRRAKIAGQEVVVVKPAIDKRYDENKIVSHNAVCLDAIPVANAAAIIKVIKKAKVVAIDEAQFFDKEIIAAVDELADKNIRVIVAGLDMDFKGEPFGAMPQLLAKAAFITKLHAICMQCGALANFSYRKKDTPQQILLGEKELYEARCRQCFYK